MLSRNALKSIGFNPMIVPKREIRNYYRFEADQTNLILIQDLGRYEIWDGHQEKMLWNGALSKPETLIRKLIEYGNNLKQ